MIKGIVPAVLSPMDPTGARLDEGALAEYVEFLVRGGVHGLFACGSTGEGVLLSVEERKRVTKTVVRAAKGKVPVIVQTGTADTAQTTELTRYARDYGADGAAVVAPFYYGLDDACLMGHYKAVLDAVPGLPFFFYNIPENAKNSIKPSLIRALAVRYPEVKGVKDSSKDLSLLEDYIAALGEGYDVLTGTDAQILAALAVGASGAVSAVAAVFPELAVGIYEEFARGDLPSARAKQRQIIGIRNVLKKGPYLSPYKAAVKWRSGVDLGGVRPPLRQASDEELSALRRALEGMGVLETQ